MANDIDIPALLQKLTADYEATKAERKRRYATGRTELSDIVGMYELGGEVGAGVTDAALTAAKTGMAGLGGPMPKTISKSMQSAIKRMKTAGKAKALTTRAKFEAIFPDIFPGPSALVNLATGGFAGLTRQLSAEALGGPLSDPYQFLSGGDRLSSQRFRPTEIARF